MKKLFKILIISFMFVITLQMSSNFVYAEVNTDYAPKVQYSSNAQGDAEGGLIQDIVKGVSSLVLEYITKFVYAVAQMVESLIKNFSSYMFGIEYFPWEDLIVFNTLPYLDINFINPASEGTLFNLGGTTVIGDAVRTIYFSLLTLAVSVIGIGVAIVAIKLAISSIAAEKAKYKEAITKCLYTVVMLFSVHILLSFIFYLNENICIAASKILSNLVQNEANELFENLKGVDGAGYNFFLLNSLVASVNDNYDTAVDYVVKNLRTSAGSGWNDFIEAFSVVIGQETETDRKADEIMEYADSIANDETKSAIADYLVSSDMGDVYLDSRFHENDAKSGLFGTNLFKDNFYYIHPIEGLAISGDWFDDVRDTQQCCLLLKEDIDNIASSSSKEDLASKYPNLTSTRFYSVIESAYDVVMLKNMDMSNIISSLAEKFKNDAIAIKDDNYGTDADTAYIAVYLYAIMLVQSIMLLLNYIKRLFYVLLLSILAPIVIIYDFFLGAF